MESDADVETIVDLMESELGPSSRKQDGSARTKFNSFLKKHIDRNLSITTITADHITKDLFGKFLAFLFKDPDIHWQTSMSYLSSIKRQQEEVTGTDLFRSDPDWYRRCRRHLQKQYLMLSISTGKKLKQQAPPMTIEDLRSISTILFLRNDKKSLVDRTLLNNQWLAIGRSSDVGTIHFSDLHWQGNFFLIDVTRIKVSQQQTISIFCSPICWSIDPFHALACQLLVDPYNTSPKVFSQVTATTTDAHVAAYINRLLKSVYDYDHEAKLTQNLQSHSARRGGAAFASSNASVNLSDLAHRGLWSMDGFATLLEYISPTAASDQNVAKVLGGWTDTKQGGHPPTLACFDDESHHTFTRVSDYAKAIRLLHFAKISPKGFADCLTATLLMYYRDTLKVSPQHIVHQEMQRVHATLSPICQCQEELLDWGSKIRKRFVMDNILALPLHIVKQSLSTEEQAEQFVGIHTFADTLERLLLGHQQLVLANEELKNMMRQILDRLSSTPTRGSSDRSNAAPEQAREAEPAPTNPLRPPLVGQSWPAGLTTLKGKKLSDFLVQYIMENLGSLPKDSSNRGQKDCLRAVEILSYVADLSSIPPLPPSSCEAERVRWISAMQRMANRCELTLSGLTRAANGAQGQRNRRRSGKLTGIVKGWSELTDQQRAAFRLMPRITFSGS
ncbi:hypothetical protein AM587_10016545 [Phytophthora nicotianae]|uniref:Uncharacterized protein n=1 Tax=Phytophthora nicotianae TaxID=4792 RepID=A0A0W8CB85_PHYNI|nr:hypothetical protein AM587_10016545 [Phytophthora nicotianae]